MNDIIARLQSRQERIHVNLGPVCNNNCIFCMEEDREERERVNGAIGPDQVTQILHKNQGAEEVCFTSGEPTMVAGLPLYVAQARDLGYVKRSVMTNGRRLSYASYLRKLVLASMNFFYISIHGHNAKLHDALVRTKGAFEQTVAGLKNVAAMRRFGVSLHTSTVVTRRNVGHLGEIYAFLREAGVQQVVFNVMQANGRADTHFERIFPPYTEIVAEMQRFLAACDEAQPDAFLVDIPLCTTEGKLPDHNRGYVERYVHYELIEDGLMPVARADLDDAQRIKRPECAGCRHNDSCEGVWRNYISRMGWDEFEPVTR